MKNKFFRSKLFSVGVIIFLMLSINACSNKPGTIGEFIYAAGWYTASGKTIACYWKNGVKTDLTDGTIEARASGIYVSGSDVYVAGSYNDITGVHACYWKTDTVTGIVTKIDLHESLEPYSVTVTSIYVIDSVVYVAGSYTNGTGNFPCYWKSDPMDPPVSEINLHGSTELASVTATSIYVIDSVVYVAGSYTNGAGIVAWYWKYDPMTPPLTEIQLPVTTAPVDKTIAGVTATSIYVSGSYVYVAGSYTNVTDNVVAARYWEAGTLTETDLPVSLVPASVTATSIYVSGAYVYVADTYINGVANYAAMWTSYTGIVPATVTVTELTELTAPAGVTATSIYMIASDVYVGGYYTNGSISVACYWKNGVRADLPAVAGKTAEVESIFVTAL